jgi:acyl carrier protein
MNADQLRTMLLDALSSIAPEVNRTAIDPRADLRDQFDLDSMDILNLAVAIHDRTGIDIPEADYPKLATLAGAIAYLSERTEGA